jgi:glutamine synthetase
MSHERIRELAKAAKQSGINVVRFQYVDTSLVLKAMVSHVDSLEENVRNGIGIGRGAAAMNAFSGVVPGSGYGPHSSEFRIVPDIETYAPLPFARGSARFISELNDLDLKPHPADSRYFLRRAIQELDRLGYIPEVAFEAEFFLLRRDGHVFVPNTAGFGMEGFIGNEGYNSANEFVQEFFPCLSQMNVSVSRLKKESGPGQIEVILKHTNALKAADDFLTLRDAAKGLAQKMGLIATFLPKPLQNEGPSGLHIHLSLRDKNSGKNVFFDPKDRRKLGFSRLGYSFIGGIMDHIKGLMPLAAPIPNSYKRLFPSDVWVPVNITYGYDNRSVAVRIPSRVNDPHGASSRLEFRVSDGTANPYLILGMVILSGIDGLKRTLDPGEPFNEDAYQLTASDRERRGIQVLPGTLGDAIAEMRKDPFIRKSLGDAIHDMYAKARESEWNTFCRTVTSWEIDNFIQSL